jgi:hypothetical protein
MAKELKDNVVSFTDRYAMQMCRRMTNGFVKIHSINTKEPYGEIVQKIDAIQQVRYYKVDRLDGTIEYVVRILSNFGYDGVPAMQVILFNEAWKAERLAHELTLLITGGDIVNDILERNQKIIDEEFENKGGD